MGDELMCGEWLECGCCEKCGCACSILKTNQETHTK